jgi:hypothetical protein
MNAAKHDLDWWIFACQVGLSVLIGVCLLWIKWLNRPWHKR